MTVKPPVVKQMHLISFPTRTHTHKHRQFYGSPGAGTRRKHSPTHTYCGHQSSLICFLHLLRSMASSLFNFYMPGRLFPQSPSKFSLVYLLAWHPPLHTPYISSSNNCLRFTAHAHTIATCSAVVTRLCHLILVSLSTLYLELYLVA